MGRLFYFIYRYRAIFLFVVLEFFSSWLIINNNQYQGAGFFNSSNQIAASILSLSNEVQTYFSLQEISLEMAEENARLKTILAQRNQSFYAIHVKQTNDLEILNRFIYINAEVVNNSIYQFKNYITINKGTGSGLKPGMAVVGSAGVVGKVKSASKHYAVVTPLLNTDEYVSSIIKNTNDFGSIRWRGINPRYTNLEFIPRHANPLVGDTVATSGFNAVFPKGVPIGIISDVKLSKEAQFYTIQVKLAQDFTHLAFVQVIQSNLKVEKDSLEQITIIP